LSIEAVLGGVRAGLGGNVTDGLRRTADRDLGGGGFGGVLCTAFPLAFGTCSAFPPAFEVKRMGGLDFSLRSMSFIFATTGSALKRGVCEPPLDFATTFSVPTQ